MLCSDWAFWSRIRVPILATAYLEEEKLMGRSILTPSKMRVFWKLATSQKATSFSAVVGLEFASAAPQLGPRGTTPAAVEQLFTCDCVLNLVPALVARFYRHWEMIDLTSSSSSLVFLKWGHKYPLPVAWWKFWSIGVILACENTIKSY